MNILWLDTETTGLNAQVNDIITLAGMIEIDGVIKEEFEFKLKPINAEAIDPEALKKNGMTKEEILQFPDAKIAKTELENILSKYVDRFKKNKTIDDKFIPAGQNVIFDIDFLRGLWEKCGDKYLGSMIDYHKLDLVPISQILVIKKFIQVPNIKLETMANYFNVPLVAHNAKSDIKATREIFYKILSRIKFEDE